LIYFNQQTVSGNFVFKFVSVDNQLTHLKVLAKEVVSFMHLLIVH